MPKLIEDLVALVDGAGQWGRAENSGNGAHTRDQTRDVEEWKEEQVAEDVAPPTEQSGEEAAAAAEPPGAGCD